MPQKMYSNSDNRNVNPALPLSPPHVWQRPGRSLTNNGQACKVAAVTLPPLHSPSTCQWVMSISSELHEDAAIMGDSFPNMQIPRLQALAPLITRTINTWFLFYHVYLSSSSLMNMIHNNNRDVNFNYFIIPVIVFTYFSYKHNISVSVTENPQSAVVLGPSWCSLLVVSDPAQRRF